MPSDRSARWLTIEAALLLGLARLAVLTVPFRIVAPWFSRRPESDFADEALLSEVRGAVACAAAWVPWRATCLPQAIAAKIMLGRRGCGSSLHLGAGIEPGPRLIAHAWLTAGGSIVTGGAQRHSVSPLVSLGAGRAS